MFAAVQGLPLSFIYMNSIFNNNNFFKFKTGDRPSQEDFKQLFLSLQNTYLPGEYRFTNNAFNYLQPGWLKINYSLFPSVTGQYNFAFMGNNFVPLVSTTQFSSYGLFELVGPNRNDNILPIATYLDSLLTFKQKYDYLSNLLYFNTSVAGISGIAAEQIVNRTIISVLSNFNFSFNLLNYYDYRIVRNLVVNKIPDVFTLIYNNVLSGGKVFYSDPYDDSPEITQNYSLPNYLSYSLIDFNLEQLFINIDEYNSYNRIQAILNAVNQNTIPSGTALFNSDVFYLSHLSGFQDLASYTTNTTDTDFDLILDLDSRNLNSSYFALPAKLSATVVDPAAPYDTVYGFNLGYTPLTARFTAGENLIINYYPYISGGIIGTTTPRSESAFWGYNYWTGQYYTLSSYKCIRSRNNATFYPVTLFNIISAISQPHYWSRNYNTIGAGIIANKYQLKTDTDNSSNQQDLIDSKIVRSTYSLLTGHYSAGSPVLSGFYVDYKALVDFSSTALALSSQAGSMSILEDLFQDEVVFGVRTLFDIPVAFYSSIPGLMALHPVFIPADTTFYVDEYPIIVNRLRTLIIPSNTLNISYFYNYLTPDFYNYYFELDIPKYNFVGASFYNELPVYGLNHPLTGDNDYYYDFPLTVFKDSVWNILSYWSTVSSLPVSASQFINFSNIIEQNNYTDFSILRNNFDIQNTNNLFLAKKLFNQAVSVDDLNGAIIKRRNNRATPFSFAVYGATIVDNIDETSILHFPVSIPRFDTFYFGVPTYIDCSTDDTYTRTGSSYQVTSEMMSQYNHIPAPLYDYYTTKITNVENITHISLQNTLASNSGTEVTASVITPPVIFKGKSPYLYSSLRNTDDYLINNLSDQNTFFVPVASSLPYFLSENQFNLFLYTGISGTDVTHTSIASSCQFDQNGGNIMLETENKKVFLFCEPVGVFNPDGSIDYSLSSYNVGLSSFTHIENNLLTDYENYFNPVSTFKELSITANFNKNYLLNPEIGISDLNISPDDIFMTNTLYFYASTPRSEDFYYLYGDRFSDETNLFKKFNLNKDNVFITLSGSYYTPAPYDNSNTSIYFTTPITTGTVKILNTRRKPRVLSGSSFIALTYEVTETIVLPSYPI
jgi:hypothetical protein